MSASKEDNRDNFAVSDGARCVGHLMCTRQAPPGKPWFWAIFARDLQGVNDRGYGGIRPYLKCGQKPVDARVWVGANLRLLPIGNL